MLFEIFPTGDPCNRTGWDVREYQGKTTDSACYFRGDLSPIQGKRNAVATLRHYYPGCIIIVADH